MTVTIEQRRGGMRIVGSGGGGKGGGGSARTPVEQPDSLHNTAYAAVLDVVGNGEMAGPVHRDEPLRDIYLNGTPIQNADGSLNFRNVQAEYRVGTQDQEHIAGFPAAASVTSVGREVGTTTPFTQLLTNPDLSAVRITLHWPQLMRMVDSGGNAGDRVGYRVEYAIDLAIGTGSFSEVLRTAADGKTVNGYTRTHRIELPQTSHGWTVRVRRLSPEPNDSAIQSKMMVQSYAEVIDGKFRYPMTAVVGIKVDAEQFQSIPTRAYHWRGQIIRVPSNYDPVGRTYSGTWDGTFKRAWSNNPAWVFYDILTNKLYGLGDRIDASMVDRYALYQIGAYCDQRVPDGQGGTEPRFTCNAYIQSSVDALRLVNDLASTFRGMTYWANGQAVGVADMPSDPIYTYSNSKVAGGVFNYTGADLSTVSTVALVSWSDPSDFYRAKVEVVQDEAGIRLFGIRKTEITAFGCSSRGQAQRVGLYHLYTSLMEQGGVSFAVGLEGVIPQPGSLVRIADANRSGRRNGGLVSAATARVVTLDADHSIKVGDRLTANLPSGKSQTRTVSGVAGRKVTVSTAFGEVPAAESSWSVDSDDLVTQLVRVISVKDVGGITFEISGVFHHPDKFNVIDSGVRLEPLPVSVVPPRVQSAPTNVRIAEHHTVRQGVSRHTAEIAWEAVDHATAYDLQWRRDSGDWVQVPRTGTRLVEIPDIYSGSYLVRVRAINALDVPSLWAYSEPTELSGQVGQPPAVAFLNATPINWGIRLNWGFPTGPNIFERTEIRYGVSSEFAQSLPAGGFAYPTNQFEQTGLAVTTEHFYWARLIDKNGTPGPWYPTENQSGVRGKPSQDAESYNDLVTKEIAEGALGQQLMADILDIPNIRDTAGSALAETGLQAQKIADNAQAIAKEVIDRGTAVAAEAQARIDGQVVAAQALADGLTAEAQARGAAITTEKTERQTADASLSSRIDTVTASAGANAAAIQQEAQARASGDSAEANARQTLAVQVRGDYSGSDVNQVSTGLIGGLKRVVADNHESVVQQMSQLQAGIGEQFDYAKMWYWEGVREGWSSGTIVDGSWLRPADSIGYVVSPRGLNVNGAEYPQVRLRLKKVGTPRWDAIVGLYAPGATASNYTMHKPLEPEWDESGIGVIVFTHTHQEVIDGVILRGGRDLSPGDYYAFDWFAIGRPAPGASTSALNNEAKLRATADIAEATSRETLSVKLTGKADPSGVTLNNVTSGLFFDEKSARVSGDEAAMTEITGLKARMPAGTGKVATEASVTTEAQARATADTALANRATALESRMPTGNGKLATADAVSALDTRVEQTESKQTSTASDVTQLKTSVTTAQNTANSAQTA
ncbi:host specificity protein J, partial [Alcaligenes endophyticus]